MNIGSHVYLQCESGFVKYRHYMYNSNNWNLFFRAFKRIKDNCKKSIYYSVRHRICAQYMTIEIYNKKILLIYIPY